MVGLSGLWMPIVLSAVFVFVMSSLIHMVFRWHDAEYVAPPQQDAVMAALRPFNIPPGEYMMPRPANMKEMGSAEHKAKMAAGPVAMLTVRPNGMGNMGGMLGKWFAYCLVVSVFAAYITGRTNAAGTHYLTIFRIAGAVSFSGYALALWQQNIWMGRSLRATITGTIDGLIFALLTAGTFGWLWPH